MGSVRESDGYRGERNRIRETEVTLERDGVPIGNGVLLSGVDDGLVVRRQNGERRSDPGHPRRIIPASFVPGAVSPVDVNLYATKKTVAQGIMDLALLTANANQLRYVLESAGKKNNPTYYYLSLSLIIISIALQIIVAPLIIILARYDIKRGDDARKANIVNDTIIALVFLITVVNLFISAFGIQQPEQVK